jgi:hypothetical protein
MEGAMLKAILCNKSVSRVEIDQRARDARLRLEQIERLLVPRAAVRLPRLRRLLSLLSIGEYGWRQQRGRIRGALSDRRPCRIEECLASRCKPECA